MRFEVADHTVSEQAFETSLEIPYLVLLVLENLVMALEHLYHVSLPKLPVVLQTQAVLQQL